MKFLTNFFNTIQKLKPTPFKTLQRKLEIEQEWLQFKLYLQPHKFKFFFFTGIVLMPFYKPVLLQFYNYSIFQVSKLLYPQQALPQVAESFGKQLITGIFNDQDVKRESGQFVQDLVKQQLVLDSIVELLVKTLKDEQFNDEAQIFSKVLLSELLEDKQVQEGILRMLLKLLRDPEFKLELQIQVKELFKADSTGDAVGELLSEAIKKEPVKQAASELISYTIQDLLLNKDIEEKLKIYFFYFFEKDDVKNIINKLLERAVKGRGKVEESKQSEFEKLMSQDNREILDNLKQRLNDDGTNGSDKTDKSKRFFFF